MDKPKAAKRVEVVNLASWAGHDFSYVPGEIVALDPLIADARKLVGLARDVTDADREARALAAQAAAAVLAREEALR